MRDDYDTAGEMSAFSPVVAEIQGLYGPFSFAEKLLQKIWLRGDFDRAAARTTDGRAVQIRHPGKWNLLGGPDFRGARLRIGTGAETIGDVELHLHVADWDAHRHARDEAYDGVVLHVVLFPPEKNRVTRGVGGREIPVLALLPLLFHDLEEYAAEEAIEVMANRPMAGVPDELSGLGADELPALLRTRALARWRQKVHFARLRAQRLGWAAACHHAALEILGFRYNRAPMLRIASRFALEEWARGAVDPAEIFGAEAGAWSLQGVRPANHPRTRLRQYGAWTKARPDWPTRLKAMGDRLPAVESAAGTREVRRQHRFTALRALLADELCGRAISGPRFDTLVCDGFLPLLASAAERDGAMHAIWFHWFAGDLPPLVTNGLRELGVFSARAQPACHGVAQGLLGWLIERETQC